MKSWYVPKIANVDLKKFVTYDQTEDGTFHKRRRNFLAVFYIPPCWNFDPDLPNTLTIAKILSGKNTRAWVSTVSYLKK